jgi:competence protein ComFC
VFFLSIVKFLLDLLYPPRCPFCNSLLTFNDSGAGNSGGNAAVGWEGLLCRRCAGELLWFQNRCPRCANLLGEKGKECGYCRGVEFAFEECVALGSYQGEIRQVLHRFKYYGKRSMAGSLGMLLGGKLSRMPWISSVEFLVPVPLYRQRLLKRGYNQAALLAGVAGKKLDLPVREVLERVKDTQSQTGLNRRQRKGNLKGAFRCCREFRQGSHILLIDDVFTSGATVQEAARVLKKAGAGRVSVAVLAR